ncbi:MAG: hypothetical protein ACM32K_08480, partial [Syntrophaceae bacterium]
KDLGGEGKGKKGKKNDSDAEPETQKKRTMSQRHYGFVSPLSEGDHSPSPHSSPLKGEGACEEGLP